MERAHTERIAVLIPAYRPADSLVDVVRALAAQAFRHIVVVDDGSGPEFGATFDRVQAIAGVELLRHATNLGKGAALKTGLNHILCNLSDVVGIVTADADGQHDPDDIARVGERLLEHPESLVLGCRAFRADVPARSRFGNLLTSGIMHALVGRKISDTQTGLRGIPASLATRILKLEAHGYEFELEMLIAAHQWGVPLVEEPIRTIYLPGNPSSHFNPLIDSMKIYFVLLRFGSISLLTALLDNLIFILMRHRGASVLLAQVVGRALALAFNYSLVRTSVFYSHQRHRNVLPKYLALSAATGTLSYGGIRLLAARFGMDAVPAKILVETLLFVVNFAVQRLFIFKSNGGDTVAEPQAPETRERPSLSAGVISSIFGVVFLAALAVESYGFGTAKLFSLDVWDPIGARRFEKYIGMFLGLSMPFLMVAPWSYPVLITGLAAVGTVASVGPMPLVAVAFFLISSCALGTLLLRMKDDESPQSQLLATLAGAAVWILAMTLVARIPVNYPLAWALLLAIPVAFDWRGAVRRLERWWRLLADAQLSGYAERAAFALVVFVLLAHWFVALMPENSADALAMHLAIPANIALNHQMTYQPARFVWAVMPMGADFAYSIVYLLGGEYAAHLLDYTFLLAIAALLYFAMRRWISRTVAFLLLALFASTPLVQLVTASLFVENVQAVMVVGMMAALWRFSEAGQRRYLYISALLAGTAMAVKFGSLAFVALAIPFLIFEAARHRKTLGRRPALVGALAVALLLATAVPPYAIAYLKTQNPLFPFLTEEFPSPLIRPNAGLVDERFKRPLTWNTLYDLTFRTNLTYEGQSGSFGFQYLTIAPLGIAAIFLIRRKKGTAAATVVALGAAAIIMKTQPNARYVYAALPLLSVPLAAVIASVKERRWLYFGLIAFAVAGTALNLRFLPSASYYHRDFCLRLPFSRAERGRYLAASVPVREVIAYFNRTHAKAPVMMGSESSIAGLDGDVYENHWHQIENYWRIRDVKTVPEMVQLMQQWGIQYFIATKPGMGDEIKPAVFADMLERCTEAEFEQGDQYLARLQPNCRPRQERPVVLVRQGFCDDFDPALLFLGDWNKDKGFAEPDKHTISYTDIEGSEVQIVFEGKALTYVYTKAANRGIASVTIDGVEQAPVDLYSAATQWQSQTRFCCFPFGRHTAVVKWTGKSSPQSKGTFIDLDSFTVE